MLISLWRRGSKFRYNPSANFIYFFYRPEKRRFYPRRTKAETVLVLICFRIVIFYPNLGFLSFRFGRCSVGRRAVFSASAHAQQTRFCGQQRISPSAQSPRLLHGPLLGRGTKGRVKERQWLLGQARLCLNQIHPRCTIHRNEVHEAKGHGGKDDHPGLSSLLHFVDRQTNLANFHPILFKLGTK